MKKPLPHITAIALLAIGAALPLTPVIAAEASAPVTAGKATVATADPVKVDATKMTLRDL